MAPFGTLGKTTCGYGFSDKTDNRRKNFGIAPADIPRWRNDARGPTSPPAAAAAANGRIDGKL